MCVIVACPVCIYNCNVARYNKKKNTNINNNKEKKTKRKFHPGNQRQRVGKKGRVGLEQEKNIRATNSQYGL